MPSNYLTKNTSTKTPPRRSAAPTPDIASPMHLVAPFHWKPRQVPSGRERSPLDAVTISSSGATGGPFKPCIAGTRAFVTGAACVDVPYLFARDIDQNRGSPTGLLSRRFRRPRLFLARLWISRETRGRDRAPPRLGARAGQVAHSFLHGVERDRGIGIENSRGEQCRGTIS